MLPKKINTIHPKPLLGIMVTKNPAIVTIEIKRKPDRDR